LCRPSLTHAIFLEEGHDKNGIKPRRVGMQRCLPPTWDPLMQDAACTMSINPDGMKDFQRPINPSCSAIWRLFYCVEKVHSFCRTSKKFICCQRQMTPHWIVGSLDIFALCRSETTRWWVDLHHHWMSHPKL
jgi:hypothetical protein